MNMLNKPAVVSQRYSTNGVTLSSICWYCRFAFAYCDERGWKGVSDVAGSDDDIIFVENVKGDVNDDGPNRRTWMLLLRCVRAAQPLCHD